MIETSEDIYSFLKYSFAISFDLALIGIILLYDQMFERALRKILK